MVSSFKVGFGGGTGKYGHELARRLAARCEVLVLQPGATTGFIEEEWPNPRPLLRHLTIASAGSDDVKYPLFTRATVSTLFSALDRFQPDVLHAHEPTPISMVAQHWARLRHVPFVMTFHVLPGRELEFGAADRILLTSLPIFRRAVVGSIQRFHRRCSAGIMMHEEVRRRLGPDSRPARLFVIPSVLDLERFQRCQTARTEETFNLSYVGFLSHRKNQLYLLEVMRHLPANFRLWLIGRSFAPRYEQKLRDYARAHGLNNVEFLGHASDDELLERLERTHVFVSASRLEVQAAVINEALASGTPVVGLDNETLDLVDDRVGARLPSGTPAVEFARRVRHICAQPRADYEEMCRQARARVAGMDWTVTVERTIAVYETLLPGRPGYESADACAEFHDPGPEPRLSLNLMMGACSLMYALKRRAGQAKNDPGHPVPSQ